MSDVLDRFEHVMLTQPIATPWSPVTDYSWEAREPIEAPNADRIVSVFHPTHVLDYGCGPGHLVRLLKARGVTVSGYDPQGCSHFHWSERAYDLVVCREVLEHVELRHYLNVVTQLCGLSTRWVYLTTRFHPCPLHLLEVATSDDLDPTHITMPHQDFLRALIVLQGFKRDRLKETELDWRGLGRVLVYERV